MAEIRFITNPFSMTTPPNSQNQKVPSQQIVVNVPQNGITYAALHHVPLGVAGSGCQPNGTLNANMNKNVASQEQGALPVGLPLGTNVPGASHQLQATFVQMATVPIQQTVGGNVLPPSDAIKLQPAEVQQQTYTQLYQFVQNDATQNINAQLSHVTSNPLGPSSGCTDQQLSNFVNGKTSMVVLGSQVEPLQPKESSDSISLKDEAALWNELSKGMKYSMEDFEPMPLPEVQSSENVLAKASPSDFFFSNPSENARAKSSPSDFCFSNPSPVSSLPQDFSNGQKEQQKKIPQQIPSMMHQQQARPLPQPVESTSMSGQSTNYLTSKHDSPVLTSATPEQVQSIGPQNPLLREKETAVPGKDRPKSPIPASASKIPPVRASCSKTISKRKRDESPYIGTVKSNSAATGTDRTSQQESADSPHSFAIRLLEQRGYSIHGMKSLESKYYNIKPTPLQLASFGTELVKAVHQSDVEKLAKLLGCGLSANPCNKFGDSLLDLVCKRANYSILDCLVKHGCDLKVCDSFGRTPLHHAAWSGQFNSKLIHLILQQDPFQLLLEDKLGKKPLQYVRSEEWSKWKEFLMGAKDSLWPTSGDRPTETSTTRTALCDPENAVSEDLAKMIASGTTSPEKVAEMDIEHRKNFQGEPIHQSSSMFSLFMTASS